MNSKSLKESLENARKIYNSWPKWKRECFKRSMVLSRERLDTGGVKNEIQYTKYFTNY